MFSPTDELKATPASRKRASSRNKRSSAVALSTLYREEEEKQVRDGMEFVGDDDPDFLPANITPFKARKRQKRH